MKRPNESTKNNFDSTFESYDGQLPPKIFRFENNSVSGANFVCESNDLTNKNHSGSQDDEDHEKKGMGCQNVSMHIGLFNNIVSCDSDEEDSFNDSWSSDSDCDDTDENLLLSPSINVNRQRKIKFADEVSKELELVFILDDSDPAYREARKGPWMKIARQRIRFTNRIQKLSKIISPILETEYREMVYEIYFMV